MAELQRVMCVEDEDDIRIIAEMALADVGGLEVMTCASGASALEAVAGFAPQLVVLDVMMPGMDGPAVLARLKERADTCHLPVVFMTAKVQPSEVARLKSLGAADVVAKPFDPMTLAEQLRAIWAGLGGEARP
ncbi:response regulator [Benzoatithermus flavus]|uniref:Response regulator n=1 Tax=Benzoatithermus flavus TaxID=3108223 RepID=A0ABU8XPK5_9PROT